MAASVRIEDKAFSDPRVKRLGRLLGTGAFDALGRMAHVWRYCCDMQVYAVGATTLADITDCDEFAEHMVSAGLGEIEGDLVRVRGLEGRIEWLARNRASAKKGGEARANSQRDDRGRMTQSPATGQPPAQPTSSPPAGFGLDAHQPLPSVAFASAVVVASVVASEEKNNSAAAPGKKQHPGFRAFTDAFNALADESGEDRPTWGLSANRSDADRVLKAAGLEKATRHAENMFREPPPWPDGPRTIRMLAQHFDRFAQPHKAARDGPLGPAGASSSQIRMAAEELARRGQ